MPEPNAPQPAREFQWLIAEQLRRWSESNPPPAERMRAFRQIAGPAYMIDEWYGAIVEAYRIPGGWQATVRLNPRVTSAFGGSTTVLGDYSETYRFRKGRIEFLEFVVRGDFGSSDDAILAIVTD